MKSGQRDKVEGTLRLVKGKAEEIAGQITDIKRLEEEGVVDVMAGKAQRKLGQIKEVLGK